MDCFQPNGDGLGVEVTDMEGFLLRRSEEDAAEIDDDWPDRDVSELMGGQLSSNESLFLLVFGHGRIGVHELIGVEVVEVQLHLLPILPFQYSILLVVL
jgi:hypothetical protein